MALTDIDAFLIGRAQQYARSTVAGIAGSLRSFTRFLLATGHISINLADSVISPVQPKFERPRRALPWEDVQHLLHSVDTSTARGLRDYALLLMMSTYDFGAGEVIGLQFQDIDWNAATLKAVRPKTGVAFMLPLLPGLAKALAFYLRDGRPPDTPTRHLFVRMKMPFSPLSASPAVRHILVKHAKAAGLDAPYLGSHVLRHSNAARQVDLGIRPRVLSDLLGHFRRRSATCTISSRFLSITVLTHVNKDAKPHHPCHPRKAAFKGRLLLCATWQRCAVHFMRNAMASVNVKQRGMVAAAIRTAFVQETEKEAHKEWRNVADRPRERFPASPR